MSIEHPQSAHDFEVIRALPVVARLRSTLETIESLLQRPGNFPAGNWRRNLDVAEVYLGRVHGALAGMKPRA